MHINAIYKATEIIFIWIILIKSIYRYVRHIFAGKSLNIKRVCLMSTILLARSRFSTSNGNKR